MIATPQLEQDLYQNVTSVTFTNFGSAALAFSNAYKRFAIQITSGTGGRATTLDTAAAQLAQVLLGAYAAKSLAGTAALLAQTLIAFWLMQPWTGGVGPGQTTNPGHGGVQSALEQLYRAGIGQGDPRYHAKELARILTMGVRQVIVTEYPPASPPKIGNIV